MVVLVCLHMVKLSKLEIEKSATISRIEGDDAESVRLHSMGLRPGCDILVLRKMQGMIHCRVQRTEFAMRDSMADRIFVE